MRPDVLAEHLATTIRGLLTPMSARVLALESAGGRLDGTIGDLTKAYDDMRDRLAVVESREPIPGPPGPPGPAGPAGIDGKDGAPGLRYQGRHVSGKAYDTGDLVTAGGSAWYCLRTTTGAPGNSGDWVLMVKRGRDARTTDRVRTDHV
jgi:hypothetical protein